MVVTKNPNKGTPKSKKLNPRISVIPNIRQYLTADFINRNFDNDTLRHQSAEPINSLINTGNLNHLRSLATIDPIYSEKVFWKQILEWKKEAYQIRYFENDEKNIPELLLETVVEGFKRAIFTYKYSKVGRPSKFLPEDFDVLNEYQKIQKELLDNLINNQDLETIRECKTDKTINRQWAKGKRKEIRDKRIKGIKRVFEGRKIKITTIQLKRQVQRTNANISYFILAKLLKTGETKVKKELAIQDEHIDSMTNYERLEFVIHIELPNNKTISIDWTKFDEARIQALQDYKDQDTYYETLSKKLKVPIEAIKTYYTHGGTPGFRKLRTPHLPRSQSKPKKSQI